MEVSAPAIALLAACLSAIQLAGPSNNSQSAAVSAQDAPRIRAQNARTDYVGDDACQSCHREKVDLYHRTAHYLTSRMPDQNSILGGFTSDGNVLRTSNPDLFFRMETKGTDVFQTAVEGVAPYTTSRTEKFGLVIGSGGKGQTYLYWKGDELFQLPVSYWKQLGWVNSPGYRDGIANFDRPIIPRCLECHGTFIQAQPPPANRYNKSIVELGISCEKCHGPGIAHVQQHITKSTAASTNILNPARFSRDRQMDLCAWCHAGHGTALQPWFSYSPGEPLNKYIDLPPPDPGAPIDVHGNQVELLKRSRCFQSSTMTCLTCHDVHRTQHDLAEFSQRCLSCHKAQSCGIFAKRGQQISDNCVDCHMPKQETDLIVFDWKGTRAKPEVRNHWIRVYPGFVLR